MTSAPEVVELRAALDEWLRGCPNPTEVPARWMVKRPSRLLWQCRDTIDTLAARVRELEEDFAFQAGLTKELLPYQERAVRAEARARELEAKEQETFQRYVDANEARIALEGALYEIAHKYNDPREPARMAVKMRGAAMSALNARATDTGEGDA